MYDALERHSSKKERVPQATPHCQARGAGAAPGRHSVQGDQSQEERPHQVLETHMLISHPEMFFFNRSNWSFGQSFLFTVTVVTTIGNLDNLVTFYQ